MPWVELPHRLSTTWIFRSVTEVDVSSSLNPALEYHVVNSLRWSDLRPLQKVSIAPVRSGADCLLVAPTAGGKTEAAIFPTLSRMVDEDWRGLSVIYVTPLKALLNNLLPRLEQYTQWLGRTVALWHGDIGPSARQRILNDPPDILLTTPESLELMLVSRRVDQRAGIVPPLKCFLQRPQFCRARLKKDEEIRR